MADKNNAALMPGDAMAAVGDGADVHHEFNSG
jgi:hypothetical protein